MAGLIQETRTKENKITSVYITQTSQADRV